MKIKRQKALHGWVFQITDDENKEVWNGNREKTIKEARASAIDGFIEERQRLVKAKNGDIKTLLSQIDKAKKL